MKKKTGVELIEEERQRQIKSEGWTASHDDEHDNSELSKAALCYEIPDSLRNYYVPNKNSLPFADEPVPRPKGWPWLAKWWKPTPENRVKELVKSGALYKADAERLHRRIELIAAEIDRLNNPNPAG